MSLRVPSLADLGLLELENASGLRVAATPSGALFSVRHGGTLISQVLPSTAERGLFRLLVRARRSEERWECIDVTGPGSAFHRDPDSVLRWIARTGTGLSVEAELSLHPTLAAWLWRVRVHNVASAPVRCDAIVAQDLGLGDECAVRNNEAYTSQYIDLLPTRDEKLGWVVLARQNQPASGGKYPWLAVGCCDGAEAYATDGWQVFGKDHRRTGLLPAARGEALPSQRLQYECAMAALQSRTVEVVGGSAAEIAFAACFEPDHPEASGEGDVGRLREVLSGRAFGEGGHFGHMDELPVPKPSLFMTSSWRHGDDASAADWDRWFPGSRRHEEIDSAGRVLSFFQGADTHVVSGLKETVVLRPHGHVLRSGEATWIDDAQFGFTSYAAGVFASQVYLGNPSFARLLPVMRNALGVMRSTGQRIFVKEDGGWRQLGVPSAFAMTPGEVRWLYRLGAAVVEVRAWCSPTRPASFLELQVLEGDPRAFLITHELVLGTAEYEYGGTVELHPEGGWASGRPAAASLVGQQEPGVCFAVAAARVLDLAELSGDEALYPDGERRSDEFVVFATRLVQRCGMILLGVQDGVSALAGAVAAARTEYGDGRRVAHPPGVVLRLRHAEPAVARLDDVVPWFNHNAAIHFSAPHGLEQYGGAAWGVRDVTQGSVEWLLTQGRHAIVRRLLETVFAQQYTHDGTWPQWFMHAPYRFIQHVHSHGDVCFWPVKALCDYVEATNDFAFLDRPVGYTDPATFTTGDATESLWAHCERVVAHVVTRFLPGTALVNYGDGDWDDTLQPADPAMRTHMVSAWTVALAYQTFHQLAEIARRGHRTDLIVRLQPLLGKIPADFRAHLMPGGVAAGFVVSEREGMRPLLHPDDAITGIRYRLLPMTRSIIAGLFTDEEARRHLAIIERELSYPDGVRLMSDPVRYRGGREQFFKRADTAANVGREIGLQYVHAHIRYAEALARVGDGEGLWRALQVVNPVGLAESVPNAAPRQSNVYFSSSDADFADRYEASARWSELRDGRVAVRGGWRLYSSGPGLYLHKVRTCLLGVRESFEDVVFDPVLPRSLDGLVGTVLLCGRRADLHYRVHHAGYGPDFVVVNGVRLEGRREDNPYRKGGLRVAASQLAGALASSDNRIEITL